MRIAELAERSGVSVRNIRFYHQAGVLPRPRLQGRTGWYDEEHLRRLRFVRQLQERGYSLAAIADMITAQVPDGLEPATGLQVGRDEQRGMLVTLDTAGRVTGTLLRFPLAGVSASHRESASGRSSVTTWLKPPTWSPEPRWDALPDGTVVFAPGGPDEAYRVGGSGHAVRFHRPMRAAGVTRQDRFRHLDGLRQRRMIASPSTSLRVLEPLNRRFYAAVRPSVTGVLAGPAGAVWTRGFDTRESWRGSSRVWNVVADAGGGRRVRLPRAFEPLQAQGGVVYGVSTDSLQVERLEAYRVEER